MNETTSLITDLDEYRAELWGSYLKFCQVFFPLVTGRQFSISQPVGRESHFITIARELTAVKRMKLASLLINVPPGHGKSVLISMWIAWTLSEFPDSQYLYISYGHELAAKHTEFVRRIIQCPHYKAIFGVQIRNDMKAKDHFMTTAGGSIKAFGSSAGIVGHDAGMPNQNRFTGAVLIDDAHKIDESHSATIRQGVIENYRETIVQRPRSPNVPIICIGQRVHEDDLPAFLLSGNDERVWKAVVLQALDGAGNALYPEVNPKAQLLEKQNKNPYVFSSQFQQEPVPAGGALFKERDFVILDEEPEFLCTFITADTAETSKTYNDGTAFSFWGLYRLNDFGQEVDELALHWIDCWEIRVEPKELEAQFLSFWGECMLHKTKPRFAAIEKKSTGTTLCSVLQDIRGLEIREVKRTKASGSKADRYLEMQPIIAGKLISFTYGARHARMCIDHMLKITANGSHRHDDLADSCYDSVKIALIDKTLHQRPQDDERNRSAVRMQAAVVSDRLRAIRNVRGY